MKVKATMKTNRTIAGWLMLLALSTLNLQIPTAFAQGTAFTYQGRLNEGTNPATGRFDLTFKVYDALSSGTLVAGPLTNAATGVTNGLFTVALDFGATPFTGAARWLEIGVRTNGGASFSTLSPLQPLTACALRALRAQRRHGQRSFRHGVRKPIKRNAERCAALGQCRPAHWQSNLCRHGHGQFL